MTNHKSKSVNVDPPTPRQWY